MNGFVNLSALRSDEYNLLNIPVLKICVSGWRRKRLILGRGEKNIIYMYIIYITEAQLTCVIMSAKSRELVISGKCLEPCKQLEMINSL